MDTGGITLLGEAAKQYVELQWYKFLYSLPLLAVFVIASVILFLAIARSIWKNK